MEIEGRLTIDLSIRSGHVDSVAIGSSRPVGASRIFHGKRVEEALQTLPLLFSICGTAQACAGVRACEQALGLMPTTQIERLREGMVRMESLREHLWRIFLDWSELLHEPPQRENMAEVLALQKRLRAALTQGHNPFSRPGDQHDIDLKIPDELGRKINELLQRAVFGINPAAWLEIKDLDGLASWAGTQVTLAARMLEHVIQNGWSDVGAADIEALPDLEPGQLYSLLEDDTFLRQPLWSGQCRETSSLTRVDSPLLRHLQGLYGNGLLLRLVARLTEIAQVAINIVPDEVDLPLAKTGTADDSGIGQVAAARGQLVHRVDLADGIVSRYQILAPTEWNFHPQGVVALALGTLNGDREQIESQARLLINAIDPCVGYELTINA